MRLIRTRDAAKPHKLELLQTAGPLDVANVRFGPLALLLDDQNPCDHTGVVACDLDTINVPTPTMESSGRHGSITVAIVVAG